MEQVHLDKSLSSIAEPIEHNEPTLVENPEDNNDAPRKSKR